jgi:hypothetical protein
LLVFLAMVCGALGGCAGSNHADTEGIKPVAARSLELFVQRSSVTTSEFEQFKVVGERLFYECGTVSRGRFVPDTQQFVSFPETMVEQYQTRLSRVVALLGPDQVFDAPGKAAHMADPGIFSLHVEIAENQHEVRTAFDSVVSPDTRVERELHALARILRAAAGGEICGNRHFYGLKAGM